MYFVCSWADPEGGGGQAVWTPIPLENHHLKWLEVSLEVLEWTSLEGQLDSFGPQLYPLGPLASRRRYILPSVKYFDEFDDYKN